MTDLPLRITEFGFEWGPMRVQRTATHNGGPILTVYDETGKRVVDIHMSAKGQSLRVFRDDQELRP